VIILYNAEKDCYFLAKCIQSCFNNFYCQQIDSYKVPLIQHLFSSVSNCIHYWAPCLIIFWEIFWTEPEISWMSHTYRGWVGGGWVNDALRHRWPSCVHSGPDRWPQQPWPYHKESGRQVEQLETTGYPINAPQWPYRVWVGPAWLDRVGKKPSVKADLLIYSNCVTVSR